LAIVIAVLGALESCDLDVHSRLATRAEALQNVYQTRFDALYSAIGEATVAFANQSPGLAALQLSDFSLCSQAKKVKSQSNTVASFYGSMHKRLAHLLLLLIRVALDDHGVEWSALLLGELPTAWRELVSQAAQEAERHLALDQDVTNAVTFLVLLVGRTEAKKGSAPTEEDENNEEENEDEDDEIVSHGKGGADLVHALTVARRALGAWGMSDEEVENSFFEYHLQRSSWVLPLLQLLSVVDFLFAPTQDLQCKCIAWGKC
jgi:hypothetical protein